MGKNCLIIGSNSFVGSNLIRYIRNNSSYNLVGTERHGGGIHLCPSLYCDVLSFKDINRVITSTKPDIIYNCSGISDYQSCEKDHSLAFDVNVKSVDLILKSITDNFPKCKFINLGSTHELSNSQSFYTETKRAARLTIGYYQNKGIWTTQPYLSNTVGRDQDSARFICPKIVQGARLIKQGKIKELELGNLDSEIKLLYVEDAVSALWEARNYELVDLLIDGNYPIKIRDLVKLIFEKLEIDNWEKYIKINPKLVRNPDVKMDTPNQMVKIKPTFSINDIVERLI